MASRLLSRALWQCATPRGATRAVRTPRCAAQSFASASAESPVYCVFGATGGVGAELTSLLSRGGGRVVAVGRDSARLDALVAACPGSSAHVCADAAAQGSAEAALEAVLALHGRVGALLLTA